MEKANTEGTYVKAGFDPINEMEEIEIGDDRESSLGSPFPSKSGIFAKRRGPLAVCVRNAYKSYKPPVPILDNFSMTVERGTIYTLLGSSGCGKSTLLGCIVGIKNLDRGELHVFGAKPGTPESGVPGKKVGYMPQEIALYQAFSISEAMRYFGTIYGMSGRQINAARDFLMEMLDLPNASRRIGSLSGGQQRRVSLAMTLVHSPELLILDEPTVGVDPLLREGIWTHLLNLVSSQKTTVIITTHYIEEARQSHVIGLMRQGRLIVETSPAALMQEYGTDQLEDIVVSLCRKDNNQAVKGPSGDNINGSQPSLSDEDGDNNEDKTTPGGSKVESNRVSDRLQRIRAVIEKNALVLLRNKVLLLFLTILPATHLTLLCVVYGGDPKPMSLGVVNHELNDPAGCRQIMSEEERLGECNVENLSCQVLRKLPPDTIKLKYYDCDDQAVKGVENGDIWGYLSFPGGYSSHVFRRAISGNIMDNATLQGSILRVRLDQSDKPIEQVLRRLILNAYGDLVKELLGNCGFNARFGEHSIFFGKNIYGSEDPSFRHFISTGTLAWLFSFYPLVSTSISYISDKKQGTMARAYVAGVGGFEVMTAYVVTEGSILAVQVGMGLLLMIPICGITLHGHLYLATALCYLTGLLGISSGLLLGTICSEEFAATFIALSTFCPNFILTGMFWPIEGVPKALKLFSTYCMSGTLAAESFRSIFTRGWGLSHQNVWPGFLSTLIWISLYMTLTFTIHRYRGN